MTHELAYCIDRQFRLVEENFWFRVERKRFLGGSWYVLSRGRDRAIETKIFESHCEGARMPSPPPVPAVY